MTKRNDHLHLFQKGYLFPEIIKRKNDYLKKNPGTSLISLGIGDTTEPLSFSITKGLVEAAQKLGTVEGYSGYGPEEGQLLLREKINETIYSNRFEIEEIFVSDGTNSDIGRLQFLFGDAATIAVQDPTYPVYVDTSVIKGRAGTFDKTTRKYNRIHYLPCLPENNFFPHLHKANRSDLLYFCSPNNPTGIAATKAQLKRLVDYATKEKSIILFDTAYSSYIQDADCPRSIYEIEGAEKVAIEMGSFSKMAGFTGVRLGWTVVPKQLRYECGNSVHADWSRIHCTFFNGASNIAQGGGLAALSKEGQAEIQERIQFYLENSRLLKTAFENLGLEVYGGINAPFLWVKFPSLLSWDLFEIFLEQVQIVTVPGSGFGPGGEHFLRFSAFSKRENVKEVIKRISLLKLY